MIKIYQATVVKIATGRIDQYSTTGCRAKPGCKEKTMLQNPQSLKLRKRSPASGRTVTKLQRLKACLPATALLFLPLFANAEADHRQEFDKTLKLDGITFHVTCPNNSSLNKLTITPKGLKKDNSIIAEEVDGTVYEAEVADLNRDNSPEIYVFAASVGSGSYGSLIAYNANHGKSLSEIYLPPLEDDKVNARGYMGHDKFFISGNHLVRSFPVYKDGDSNAGPSGGTRRLEYKLVPGETGWQLKLVKSSSR